MNPANHFSKGRDLFLANLFRHDYENACQAYGQLCRRAAQGANLAEEDQKAINQAQRAYKRYAPVLERRCGETHAKLRKVMSAVVRRQCAAVEMVTFDDWKEKNGLTGGRLETILPNVSSLQLSSGCSHFCRRCNEWALPGVRKHFSYSAAVELVRRLHRFRNKEFSLYGASDPLDWRDGQRTIVDLIDRMTEAGLRLRFGLLTKLPRGSLRLLKGMVRRDIEFGVSVTRRNRDKVLQLQKQLGTTFALQHDSDELMIPAGLDEDFRSVKSSITDNYGVEITPDGTFMTIPTFTSALNPTGQFRVPLTDGADRIVAKKVGREALAVTYFKPLTFVNRRGRETVSTDLLAPQVENLLLDGVSADAVPPGMMGLEEFFNSFDLAAVDRRRKMFAAVVRRIRTEVGRQENGPAGPDRPAIFRRRVSVYARLCREADSIELRRYAISFLLAAVRRYVVRNTDRSAIVQHLRRSCRQGFPDDLLKDRRKDPSLRSGAAAMLFFHRMAARLLADPGDSLVKKIIDRRPSRYDAETETFLPDRLAGPGTVPPTSV